MLERHEGRNLCPYRDTKGKLTIGYGWNMDANKLPSDIAAYLEEKGCIKEEMGQRLLDDSITKARDSAYRLFPRFDHFDTARQNALIDLLFMGEAKIRDEFPRFVTAVNRQDWQRAADEIKYSNGLTKEKLSDYWVQLKGDRVGGDETRPQEVYRLLSEGE